VIVASIDASSDGKCRGYALTDESGLLWYGAEPPSSWPSVDVAAVEGQYPNPKSSRQSLITLGNYAGFLLGRVPARLWLIVPVQAWKARVIPGFANAAKAMYTANLRQMYPHVEPLPGSKTTRKRKKKEPDPASDILDAIGLGRSFFSPCRPYTAAELGEWEMT
jgi:hypothetical protein